MWPTVARVCPSLYDVKCVGPIARMLDLNNGGATISIRSQMVVMTDLMIQHKRQLKSRKCNIPSGENIVVLESYRRD